MTGDDEFLSQADVASLTGKSQAGLQCAELERRGIPYIVGAKGRPQVSRYHVRQIALGAEVRQSVGPRLDLVR